MTQTARSNGFRHMTVPRTGPIRGLTLPWIHKVTSLRQERADRVSRLIMSRSNTLKALLQHQRPALLLHQEPLPRRVRDRHRIRDRDNCSNDEPALNLARTALRMRCNHAVHRAETSSVAAAVPAANQRWNALSSTC